MAIITLLSDFGTRHWHVAALKGTIERVIPGAHVVDISHDLKFEDNTLAALVLRYAWPHFPANTLHFVSVDAAPHGNFPYVAAKFGGQYFLCKDDGFLSMMLNGEEPEILMDISNVVPPGYTPLFAARDIYVKVAALILSGTPLQSIGLPRPQLTPKLLVAPTFGPDHIQGAVLYTDPWGNACTNITKDLFQRVGAGRPMEILLKRPSNTLRRIHRSYAEVPDGELLALFNSVNHLEIAIHRGSARQYCGLEPGDQVRIQFFASPR
ncbi:MAG: SAM-dependent chlorinase/fluorinase [Flavobacteriales bacterium]|nr:SAM-dependent chlorinase/fluorinase [Flavobacteriales bacterium]MDW8432598.1 SAM-dependent chlorinase/fluorinase [Flavobacteriales bacterium]